MKSRYNILLTSILLGSTLTHANSISIEQSHTDSSKHYVVTQQGKPLYHAKLSWQADKASMHILQGHQSQLGALIIYHDEVVAYTPEGTVKWRSVRKKTDKICLPEMFPEFIQAHLSQLKSGVKLTCKGPIFKAKKLAPFSVSIDDYNDQQIIAKVGPGSIGMWFFMDTINLHLDKSAHHITYYDGTTPAPIKTSGKMTYLTYRGTISKKNQVSSVSNSVFW